MCPRRPVTVALLAVGLSLAGCGETTYQDRGTPAQERKEQRAVDAVQGFWRAFTGGDAYGVCQLSARRLNRLRRLTGGKCSGSPMTQAPSQGLDVYDIWITGERVKVLTGGHEPYEGHRMQFTTNRENGRWKVERIILLSSRTHVIRR